MKIEFRKSFARDLKRIQEKHLLKRVGEVIQEIEVAESILEIKNLKKLKAEGQKYERLIQLILSGRADTNIAFDDLCNLLLRCGFDMRVSESHHIFIPKVVENQKLLYPNKSYFAKKWLKRL